MGSLPYPENPGATHWEGCWRTHGHHNCAVAQVDVLVADLREGKESVGRLLRLLGIDLDASTDIGVEQIVRLAADAKTGAAVRQARPARRWRVMSDGSGHDYVCPAELVDEAHRMFRAVEEYWEADDQTGPVPLEPDFAHRVEGSWTFTDPEENGEHFDPRVP